MHYCNSKVIIILVTFLFKEADYINITSLGSTNISLTDTRSMNAIDISILKKSLDAVETSGDMITRMMEQSVNPNIGANIDIRL